ncbi:hypothetical protein [Thermococcus waiotapuensis]|uniref:Uncharacterized protein n=1 Tax=Thermococcus waiotapuensis TaxID=90909 RepID=A0AAE4NU42_9EURY|nr:hypothetical protein [Thermococcus waiotapuensis]MDV3103391.1 hypothetical protein [Thermococcus waiotapuensis]
MRVAVITRDARAYYQAVNTLKKYGIGFHSLTPGDKIPFDVEVVLVDESTFKQIDFPVKILIGEDFIDELLAILEGRERFSRVYIAIDPGERPGVSVIADNRVLEVHRLKGPKDVEPILELLKKYPGARIKIGHGAKRQRVLMLKALGQLLGYDYRLILVNESGTTPRVGDTESKGVQDIVAAINIGLRQGREVSIRELLDLREPTKREIDDIKKRSRELSGNITISSDLAREVALGNMTLEEALERQRRKSKLGGQ